MPNIVNQYLQNQLEQDFEKMGSCIVLNFDRLTVSLTDEIRNRFREEGVAYRVVKNRLAVRAFDKLGIDMSAAFSGKCGVVLADEEKAISAAKIAREFGQSARRALRIRTPPMLGPQRDGRSDDRGRGRVQRGGRRVQGEEGRGERRRGFRIADLRQSSIRPRSPRAIGDFPKRSASPREAVSGVGEGIRTPDLRDHNPAL